MNIKLFVGIRYSPDRTIPQTLIKIPHEGKEYIGFYLDTPKPTLNELHHAMARLKDVFQKEWEDVRSDTLAYVVFPELFCG